MNCRICGFSKLGDYLSFNHINLLTCKRCKIIFMQDIPSFRTISGYYLDGFYDKEKGERFLVFFETLIKVSRYFRVMSIEKFCKKPGSIVDVGFSRGVTMRMLKTRGWQTFGTQISINAYENAKKNGLDVFLGRLHDAGLKAQSVDLVTYWHVFEHLDDPEQYLKETNRILKKGGKLIIEVPNMGGLVAKLFNKKWFALDLPRHIYHFSPYSLDFILRKNGFLVVKKTYFSIEQSIFSLLQSILNLFNSKNNLLFDSMKKGLNNLDFSLVVYNWLLAGIFLFPCILFSLLISFTSKGDIMRFYCVKIKEA